MNPGINSDASVFLNGNACHLKQLSCSNTFVTDPRTIAALHAPTSFNWTLDSNFPFGAGPDGSPSKQSAVSISQEVDHIFDYSRQRF